MDESLLNFEQFPYLCPPKNRVKTYQGGINTMLIIDSKDCENIDKALKKYKKKFEKSKTLLKLRELQSFTKPSVKRRGEVLKAIYQAEYCQRQDRKIRDLSF